MIYEHNIPDDFMPEVTIVEPQPWTSLGMFARTMSKATDFRVMEPVTGKKGWISGLYLSGPAVADEMGKRFYEYESDVYLFSNSTRVADVMGLIPGYLSQVALVTWLHSGESLFDEGDRDRASQWNNLASFDVCHKIFGGAPVSEEILRTELYPLQFNNGETSHELYTGTGCRILQKYEFLPLGYDYKRLIPYRKNYGEHLPRKTPIVGWTHRLSFDCNPGAFARIILSLLDREDFNVIITQNEAKKLPIWQQMLTELRNRGRLLHHGYIADWEEYVKTIAQIDIIVSTKKAETFGYSIAESTVLGSVPLVPTYGPYACFYPEEFRADITDEVGFAEKLQGLIYTIRNKGSWEMTLQLAPTRENFLNKYDWSVLRPQYRTAFRRAWLDVMQNMRPAPSPSSEKCAQYIRANGPTTKRVLLNNVLGWGGIDWYGSIRWKLLNAGFRTRIEDNEVVWYAEQ